MRISAPAEPINSRPPIIARAVFSPVAGLLLPPLPVVGATVVAVVSVTEPVESDADGSEEGSVLGSDVGSVLGSVEGSVLGSVVGSDPKYSAFRVSSELAPTFTEIDFIVTMPSAGRLPFQV